jgi:hypothetical protein
MRTSADDVSTHAVSPLSTTGAAAAFFGERGHGRQHHGERGLR